MDLVVLIPLLLILGTFVYVVGRRNRQSESEQPGPFSPSGLTGKPRGLKKVPPQFQQRTFSMPCTMSEAIEVIAATSDFEGKRPFGLLIENYLIAQQRGEAVGAAPLVNGLYLESLSTDRLVIAAGNRVATKWRLQLVLTGGMPVLGSFGALEVNSTDWFGNVMSFNLTLKEAVMSVGGSTGPWPNGP